MPSAFSSSSVLFVTYFVELMRRSWLKVNAMQSTFCRVKYDDALLEKLGKGILSMVREHKILTDTTHVVNGHHAAFIFLQFYPEFVCVNAHRSIQIRS